MEVAASKLQRGAGFPSLLYRSCPIRRSSLLTPTCCPPSLPPSSAKPTGSRRHRQTSTQLGILEEATDRFNSLGFVSSFTGASRRGVGLSKVAPTR